MQNIHTFKFHFMIYKYTFQIFKITRQFVVDDHREDVSFQNFPPNQEFLSRHIFHFARKRQNVETIQ